MSKRKKKAPEQNSFYTHADYGRAYRPTPLWGEPQRANRMFTIQVNQGALNLLEHLKENRLFREEVIAVHKKHYR